MGKGASARRGAPVLLGRAQPRPGPPRARLTGSRTMPAKAGGSQERRKGRLVSRPGAGSGQERRAVPGGASGEAGGLRAETRREESSVKSVPDGRLGSTARVSSVGVRTRSRPTQGTGVTERRPRELALESGACGAPGSIACPNPPACLLHARLCASQAGAGPGAAPGLRSCPGGACNPGTEQVPTRGEDFAYGSS